MLATHKPHIAVTQQDIYKTTGDYSFSIFYARWSDHIGTISSFRCGDSTPTQRHESQTEGWHASSNRPEMYALAPVSYG